MPKDQGSGGCSGKGHGRDMGSCGRMGSRGIGSGGSCVCPDCGHKVPHERGTPCMNISCPNCGSMMTREQIKERR